MARKKFIKIPFFKFKINKHTILNIFGFALIVLGLICILALLNLIPAGNQGGVQLQRINQYLFEKFGGLAFLIPFVILHFAGLFFNTKKLKIMKPNVSIGILLILIAFLGLFHTGEWGKQIFESLSMDFSLIGSVIILVFTLLVGIILFLDTSVDVFFLFILKAFKRASKEAKKGAIEKEVAEKTKKSWFGRGSTEDEEEEEVEPAFIQDNKTQEKPKMVPAMQTAQSAHTPTHAGAVANKDFSIKPIQSTASSTWVYPPLNLLHDVSQREADRGDVNRNADIIEKTLDSFGIRARVSEVNKGPTVTQYALEITMGTKLSKITSLGNDLALALAAPTGQVRIEAPIPGRSLVGIEIPNLKPEIVTLKKMLSAPVFTQSNDPLMAPMGLDVGGQPQAASIARMPHVLIAGTTGSGKSVILNAWITTFLFRCKPDELRMILIDPKRVELNLYNGIPHLLTDVIVEPDKILSALRWTVAEMENRYKEFAKVGVRNLDGFNAVEGVEKKPFILFVIDELADLMMFAPGDAEDLITRIAQMARATGIHLILATQRPSVDVITGLMKANIPSRIAFSVSSMIDSRVIIDSPGAEKLLGKGDMLFLPADQAKPRRIQGAYITEKEVHEVVKFLKSQVPVVHYTEEITALETAAGGARGGVPTSGGGGGGQDALFNQALDLVIQDGKASASLLQRRLKVGYARAARILDELEAAGYVGHAEGSKPREILKRPMPEAAENA